MSADGEFEILCSRCKVPVDGRVDDQGHEIAVCPSCGLSAPLDEAVREASEHFVDEAMREMMKPLQGFKSNFVSMTVTQPEQRSFRFISRKKE